MQEHENGVALLLVAPLVQVAWADGHVSDGERLSVLEVAAPRLIDSDSSAYDQLLNLLWHRPSKEFFARGLAALRSAFDALPFAESLSMRRDLIASCTRIAAASRSAIGLQISERERRTIDLINAGLESGARCPTDPRR